MNKQEIYEVLDTAISQNFLDSIEFLSEKERDYKKSDFFKKTRIPLMVLYEKYYMINTKKTISMELREAVRDFDMEIIYGKIEDLLDYISDDEKINTIIEKIVKNFDPDRLDFYREKLEEIADKLQ